MNKTTKKNEKRKWTEAQIEEQIQRIQKVIEEQKRLVKENENFIAVTPEDIRRKLKRTNSPMIMSLWGNWLTPTVRGATFYMNVSIYNPDPNEAKHLFAHVWVGSGNIDPTVGTFLLNVDTRFPRLTQPAFEGLKLNAYAWTYLGFLIDVPSTVQTTNYLGNCCLMQLNWIDVGTYLDRGIFVFTVI